MKRLTYLCILLTLVFLVSGCAGMFKVPEQGADFGIYPDNYKELITEYMGNRLKDPDSAKYRFGTPQKAYKNNGIVYGGDVVWLGYTVTFSVNAKNSYGGYTGFGEPYIALIRGDRVYDADLERTYKTFNLLRHY